MRLSYKQSNYHNVSDQRKCNRCMGGAHLQGLLKRLLSNLHIQIHLAYAHLRLDTSGHPIRSDVECGSFHALFAFVLPWLNRNYCVHATCILTLSHPGVIANMAVHDRDQRATTQSMVETTRTFRVLLSG